jgi:hypothetical protein
MDSEDFYARLPVLTNFAEISRAENYRPLPDDWQVAVTDVEGSTLAVRQGRYKDVNVLGASSIVSVLNIARPLEIPFVFGGDGASLCVPPSLVEKTREALRATRRLAREEFRLSLRAGMVPVRFIHDHGFQVRVARCRTSAKYIQAAFSGGGVQFAEQCIKDPQRGEAFRIQDDETTPTTTGDFSGLECRWDNIPSPHGEIVTLLVQAISGNETIDAQTYRDALDAIADFYGDAQSSNPVVEESLRLTLDRATLDREAKLHARPTLRGLYRLFVCLQSMVGQWLMDRGIKTPGVDWGAYKSDVIANSDFRKFDDLLRHILSGTTAQRERLTAFLEDRYRRGELVYGLHWAPTALMTCLIFQRNGGHIHFVDGADGGYAIASEDLKRRLFCRIPA